MGDSVIDQTVLDACWTNFCHGVNNYIRQQRAGTKVDGQPLMPLTIQYDGSDCPVLRIETSTAFTINRLLLKVGNRELAVPITAEGVNQLSGYATFFRNLNLPFSTEEAAAAAGR